MLVIIIYVFELAPYADGEQMQKLRKMFKERGKTNNCSTQGKQSVEGNDI